jgi:hypothetical protein
MKAFRTITNLITSVVIAETAGKAKHATYLSAKESGFKVNFLDIQVWRLKSLDHLAKPLPCGRQIIPNCVMTPEFANKPCGCTKCIDQAILRLEGEKK